MQFLSFIVHMDNGLLSRLPSNHSQLVIVSLRLTLLLLIHSNKHIIASLHTKSFHFAERIPDPLTYLLAHSFIHSFKILHTIATYVRIHAYDYTNIPTTTLRYATEDENENKTK